MTSKKFQQFLQVQGIEHQPMMAYHQLANSLVEWVIQTIKTMVYQWLAELEQPLTDWDKVIGDCTMAYNMAVQESIGKTPF